MLQLVSLGGVVFGLTRSVWVSWWLKGSPWQVGWGTFMAGGLGGCPWWLGYLMTCFFSSLLCGSVTHLPTMPPLSVGMSSLLIQCMALAFLPFVSQRKRKRSFNKL